VRRIVSITGAADFSMFEFFAALDDRATMQTFAPCIGMEHITSLWLSDLSLKSLSITLTQLHNLTALGVTNNDIEFSGDTLIAIDGLTKLKTLHLQSNRFFDGDLQWRGKPNLRNLGCDMQHCIVDLFQPPVQLTQLILYECQTLIVYAFVERLTNLRVLTLCDASSIGSLRLESQRALQHYYLTWSSRNPYAIFQSNARKDYDFIVKVHRRLRWFATERLIDLVLAFGPMHIASLILAHFSQWIAECDRITFAEKMEFIRGVNERLRRLRTNGRGLRATPARMSSAIRRKLTWNN